MRRILPLLLVLCCLLPATGQLRQAHAYPISADLSAYNPPVGDQWTTNGCASWATGYYLRGWYALRAGNYPQGSLSGFAPMYLYSQADGGVDNGSSVTTNLQLLQSQGMPPRSVYSNEVTAQGYWVPDLDWIDQPNAADHAAAAPYRITSYTTSLGTRLSMQDWIEAQISAGSPVVVALPIYSGFLGLGASSWFYGSQSGYYIDDHALFASKYDAAGLWVENSFGTGWGLNGYAELSWSVVNQWVYEAYTESVSGTLPPTATPGAATNTPVPTATATATIARPTPTSTPIVIPTRVKRSRV